MRRAFVCAFHPERRVKLLRKTSRFSADLLALAGVGLVVAGVWMIYRPAALILAGSLLVFVGVRLEAGE